MQADSMRQKLSANWTLKPADMSIEENLSALKQELEKIGRNVRIVVVTKTHGPEVISRLLLAGHRDFGESRVNEARAKAALVEASSSPIYHHIGPLQSGNARQIAALFSYVHGASSRSAIQALAENAKRFEQSPEAPVMDSERWPIRYLLQIRLTDEQTKLGGMTEEELRNTDRFLENSALKFSGFMTMGPENGDPIETREVFHRLREIKERYKPDGELSMGMSQDWRIAVEEGATITRPGSLILGERKEGPWKG